MSSLEFVQPAAGWLEALPLGNGRLGAMCWGGVSTVRFDLNDETVWSGSPASEAAQPRPSAASAAVLLAKAREQVLAGAPAAAARAVHGLQSDYSQAFLPLATVTVRVPLSVPAGYRRSLDLTTGLHSVSAGAGDDRVLQRTVVSAPDGVLLHVIDAVRPSIPAAVLPSGAGATEMEVEIDSPLRVLERRDRSRDAVLLLRAPSDVAPTHEPSFPAAQWSDAPGAAVEAVVMVRRVSREALGGDGRYGILIATDSTYGGLGRGLSGTIDDAFARATARLDAAEARGVDAVLDRAEADTRALLGRVAIEFRRSTVPRRDALDGGGRDTEQGGVEGLDTGARLARAFGDEVHPLAGDPALAGVLFEYGRYLLAASSRPGGLPATLQGIWNDSMQPPWSSNYTLNINLQMNYWPAQVADLAETAEPLHRFVDELSRSGAETAERLYGARGWVAHHNSDAWLFSSMAGARHGDPSWAFWPMAGPWLVRHLWAQVQFGADAGDAGAFLREVAWPVIRRAAEFGLDWLITLGDGSRATVPSTSPENTFRDAGSGEATGLTASSALDLQLLRELFETTLAAAAASGAGDAELLAEVRDALASLPARPALTADGRIAEWGAGDAAGAAVDPHHRHVSPLYFVYPGVGPLDDELRAAATRFLEARGNDSSGWSLAWKLALWARLKRPDKVSDLLRLVVRDADAGRGSWSGGLYPNLFAAHPPFQIDGNLGFVAALAECLVQSHDGAIELLPAVPTELATGSVRGLVARPGVLVDLGWADGALVRVTLRLRHDAIPPRVRVRLGDHIREITLTTQPTFLTPADFAPALETAAETSTTR